MKRQPHYSKGQKIGGRYLVHQALMGGMGEVYLCLDTRDMIPYALKTFQGSSPHLKDIFHEEVAKWIALERHPNIVRCHWMQVLDNRPFAVMDWIASDESKGTDLRAWLRQGKLDLKQALLFTIDIVRGLLHAGAKVPGIVHRDLKPENVLVNQARQAKINDFGLALVAQKAGLQTDTEAEEIPGTHSLRVGQVVGTPVYMAPEQWRGETDLDARTDLYAVGCILYELLTGDRAFPPPHVQTQSEFLRVMEAQHLHAPLPGLPGNVPAALTPILNQCLAKTYAGRYEHPEVLLAALLEVYETAFGEHPPEVEAEEFTAADYNNRGVTLRNLGQPERAIADYDAALRLDPHDAEVYMNRGNIYSDLGQHAQAMADFDQAVCIDPNYPEPYISRSNLHSKIGNYKAALMDVNRAIELNPQISMAFNNRGFFYPKLGQLDKALIDLSQAIELDPKNTLAWGNRGNLYNMQNKYEAAIDDYTHALESASSEVRIYINRGELYCQQKNTRKL